MKNNNHLCSKPLVPFVTRCAKRFAGTISSILTATLCRYKYHHHHCTDENIHSKTNLPKIPSLGGIKPRSSDPRSPLERCESLGLCLLHGSSCLLAAVALKNTGNEFTLLPPLLRSSLQSHEGGQGQPFRTQPLRYDRLLN